MSNSGEMSGREFVEKVIEGERDFSGIELEAGFDLGSYEMSEEMQNKLRKRYFETLDMRQSRWLGVDAQGIRIPNLFALGADFAGANFKEVWMGSKGMANFKGANLQNADFSDSYLLFPNFIGANLNGANFNNGRYPDAYFLDACLYKARFKGSNLCGALFSDADLTKAIFHDSDLRGAYFHRANVEMARFNGSDLVMIDFRDAKNLDKANLTGARLAKITVTEKEKRIIEDMCPQYFLEDSSPDPNKRVPWYYRLNTRD